MDTQFQGFLSRFQANSISVKPWASRFPDSLRVLPCREKRSGIALQPAEEDREWVGESEEGSRQEAGILPVFLSFLLGDTGCSRPWIVLAEARGWEACKALGPVWRQNPAHEGSCGKCCMQASMMIYYLGKLLSRVSHTKGEIHYRGFMLSWRIQGLSSSLFKPSLLLVETQSPSGMKGVSLWFQVNFRHQIWKQNSFWKSPWTAPPGPACRLIKPRAWVLIC